MAGSQNPLFSGLRRGEPAIFRFSTMDRHFAYKFIGFGALHGNVPYESKWFGSMDRHFAYDLLWFGATDGHFGYEYIYRVWGHG